MDSNAITAALAKVTKDWTKQRKAEERQTSRAYRRHEVLTRVRRYTIKDAAWETMNAAYMKASSNNTLPAHARQIMYAARGYIQEQTGRILDDQYFTQTLLPDYMDSHRELTANWDVVFDARGHLSEPHTGIVVPLGTLDVRKYLAQISSHLTRQLVKVGRVLDEDSEEAIADSIDVPTSITYDYTTHGPQHRYSAILFIEKEGFMPLFEKVKLADRYDIAIMSTKGLSNTAARGLVDHMFGLGVPLLVLHDFDKAGFSIFGTLQRNTRRYMFNNRPNVIDLGLRLADVEQSNLAAESVSYGRANPGWNLKENGATDDEVAFLCPGARKVQWQYGGQRVELNAFASRDLVQWVEAKLEEHGVEKVIPSNDTLVSAYRRAIAIRHMNERLDEIRQEAIDEGKEATIPENLRDNVMDRLKRNPALSWDAAIADCVRGNNAPR